MNVLISWFLASAAILVSAFVLPGVQVEGLVVALVLAVVLGAINAFLRPILIFLTFPITILSLGLFILVLDALLIMLAALVVSGFSVGGFWWALLFALVLTLVNAVFYRLAEGEKLI